MFVTINGNRLNVEVRGPEDGTLLIAHHGAPGLGTLTEPRNTFGPLSDTYGRRRPLLVGLLGYGAASLLCALAPSILALTLLRAPAQPTT